MSVSKCITSYDEEETERLLSKNSDDIVISKKPSGYGVRHTLTILSFLAFFNVYAMRVNLSIALVAMVNSSTSQSNETDDKECPDNAYIKSNSSSNSKISTGEFNWNEELQGVILGSFFYGYIVTQIPAGRLAEKFGAKILLGLGVLVTSVFTLLTPLAARLGVFAFIVVRVLEGIGEGVTFPAMHAMLGKWAPTSEISILSTFIYGGSNLGTVVSTPISGILCGSDFLGGWPSVFYVFGTFGCIWFLFWMFLVYDSPSDHPRITEEEKHYIEQSLGRSKQKLPIPWKSILMSLPVWSLCVAHFTASWGFYALLTCLPTYMSKIQKYEITQNGLLVSLPYLACWVTGVLSGFIADFLKNKHLSTGVTRKLLSTLGLVVSGVTLVLIKEAGCNHVTVVTLLVVSMAFTGLVTAGIPINHLDISPNFAGSLMGITNTFATASGILAPYVIGLLTNNNQTINQWQIVFYLSAGLNLIGSIVFTIFGSGNIQKWNGSGQEQEIIVSESDTMESVKRKLVQ